MKRFLLVVALVAICVWAFAEITPYGSARIGYWLENYDKDASGYGDSVLESNYFLQNNSRLGINFKQGDYSARGEINGAADTGLRLLWAKQEFVGWSLLIGQDDFMGVHKANQVYGSNMDLVGYGAIDGARRAQVRANWDNGIYLAALPPNMISPVGAPNRAEFLFPMLNLGYTYATEDYSIAPAVVFQMFQYDKKKNNDRDGSVMSMLGAVTGSYNLEPVVLKASVNFGINSGNMGFGGSENQAGWDPDKEETLDTTTLGGWLTACWFLNETVNFTVGGGYAMSSYDIDDAEDDTRMSFFVQSELQFGNFKLIPEVGMLNDMDDIFGEKEGSMMYFGTQLRLDF